MSTGHYQIVSNVGGHDERSELHIRCFAPIFPEGCQFHSTGPLLFVRKMLQFRQSLQERSASIISGGRNFPLPTEKHGAKTQKNELVTFPEDWPEIEYVIAETAGPVPAANYALIYTVLVAPLSRGNVTINWNDTSDVH